MACRPDATNDESVSELAKQQLLDLFVTSTPSQWCTVLPKCNRSLECTPSNSTEHFSLIPGCEEEVKELLKTSFEKMFTNRGHVETFWEDFTLRVTHKLGLTYREVQKRNGTLSSYSEAKLQQCILNPILREVSKAACIIPYLKEHSIKTDFLIEDEIEIQEGKSGQKPSVDAVIQLSNKKDVAVAYVPIEMKVEIDPNHYSQIACYMNKVSTAEGIHDCVMVGVIIDKKQFRLAFSAYCDKNVPLPIVHISPPIEWRSESDGIIFEQSMLILACTFLVGQMKRIQFDSTKSYDSLPGTTLIEIGKSLFDNPYKLKRLRREEVSSRYLMNEVAELKLKDEKKQREIEELKKKLENQQKLLEDEMLKRKKPRRQ